MRPSKARSVALTVLIAASILTLMPLSTAVSVTPMRLTESDISAAPYIMIYKADGNYPMNHWVNTDCMHPIINVDNNSASIRINVGITGNVYYPAGLGTLMNAGGYLTKVSYSASWQGNHETVVYTGDATKHEGEYQFNLTASHMETKRSLSMHLAIFCSSRMVLHQLILFPRGVHRVSASRSLIPP